MVRIAPLCLLLTLLCTPARADLVEASFPGKSEADIAREFEAGLPNFLAARSKEQVRPRIRMEINRRKLFLEVYEVKDGEVTWAELARRGWVAEHADYGYTPDEGRHTIKLADIPARQVANWYLVPYRLPNEVVALAVWLAGRGEVMAANSKLAEVAKLQPGMRSNIEAWLKLKHGWKPDAALEAIESHDYDNRAPLHLLLTAAAKTERLKALDKRAKEALKELQEAQGEDLKGNPGSRRRPPTMRLDVLKDRLERFPLAFGETATGTSKSSIKLLGELLEAVKADLEWVEIQGHRADRLGLDGDLQACADHWQRVLRADPENFNLLMKAAKACQDAAGVKDNGLRAEKPDRALQAAALWEQYLEHQPFMLSARNYAGLSFMAAGKKAEAKAHFDEVMRRTNGAEDEGSLKNREYAEARLKALQ